MKKKRRKFTAAFKSKVALEALREDRPNAAIASRHRIHSNQVSSWKRKAVEGMRYCRKLWIGELIRQRS